MGVSPALSYYYLVVCQLGLSEVLAISQYSRDLLRKARALMTLVGPCGTSPTKSRTILGLQTDVIEGSGSTFIKSSYYCPCWLGERVSE